MRFFFSFCPVSAAFLQIFQNENLRKLLFSWDFPFLLSLSSCFVVAKNPVLTAHFVPIANAANPFPFLLFLHFAFPTSFKSYTVAYRDLRHCRWNQTFSQTIRFHTKNPIIFGTTNFLNSVSMIVRPQNMRLQTKCNCC